MRKKYNNFEYLDKTQITRLSFNFNSFFSFCFYIKQVLPKYIFLFLFDSWEIELTTSREYLLKLLFYLKGHSAIMLQYLVDIVVVDFPGKKLRFQITYLFMSVKYNTRYRIRVFTNELIPIQSIVHLYSFANWPEREIWDLFGILITGHPDLRRLLTDYGFAGFPLRKDFPLSGFYEIIYDDAKKMLVEIPICLAQEYRFFEFNNPWKQ